MSQETWRDVLRHALSNPKRKKQVAAAMQVNEMTLRRWITGETERPPDVMLNQLLAALPEEREELSDLLRQDFPDFEPLVQPDIVLSEVSVQFYAQVLEAYGVTAVPLRFWTLSSLILRQVLLHLERESSARFQVTVVRCTHPVMTDAPVRSLYEGIGLGTPPYWTRIPELRVYYLGAESLAGYVISHGVPAMVQDAREEYPRVPVHWAELEQSAAAFPLVIADSIAGALRVSATLPNFFTYRVQKLLSYYARMLVLAFSPEDFFSRARIRLDSMPYYKLQDPILTTFSARIAACMDKQECTYQQAERLARIEIEEELRRVVPTSPRYGGNDAQIHQSEPGQSQ